MPPALTWISPGFAPSALSAALIRAPNSSPGKSFAVTTRDGRRCADPAKTQPVRPAMTIEIETNRLNHEENEVDWRLQHSVANFMRMIFLKLPLNNPTSSPRLA